MRIEPRVTDLNTWPSRLIIWLRLTTLKQNYSCRKKSNGPFITSWNNFNLKDCRRDLKRCVPCRTSECPKENRIRIFAITLLNLMDLPEWFVIIVRSMFIESLENFFVALVNRSTWHRGLGTCGYYSSQRCRNSAFNNSNWAANVREKNERTYFRMLTNM